MKKIKIHVSPRTKFLIVVFSLLNLFIYIFILGFHNAIPFSSFDYFRNAHHFIKDSRVSEHKFKLINNLAQYDAQWYLKIAENGYPTTSSKEDLSNRSFSGLSFAFFPMYPATIGVLNFIFRNILLSAFLFSNLMLFVNFVSLIFVARKIESEDIAIKTAFLLFFFPFSIFYRSYFTESLFLFLLIWFSYFFIKKQNKLSGLFLGLLNITRGAGVLIYIPYFYYLLQDFRKKKVNIVQLIQSVALSVIPIALWVFYVYHKTGDLFYFMKTRSAWTGEHSFVNQIIDNINRVAIFSSQALHSFHSSKIDIAVILLVFSILVFSLGQINKKLWLISLCIFLAPLIFNDTMSYTRMQIVSFPLFLFISKILRKEMVYFMFALFYVGLLITSIIFINWYWVG